MSSEDMFSFVITGVMYANLLKGRGAVKGDGDFMESDLCSGIVRDSQQCADTSTLGDTETIQRR